MKGLPTLHVAPGLICWDHPNATVTRAACAVDNADARPHTITLPMLIGIQIAPPADRAVRRNAARGGTRLIPAPGLGDDIGSLWMISKKLSKKYYGFQEFLTALNGSSLTSVSNRTVAELYR